MTHLHSPQRWSTFFQSFKSASFSTAFPFVAVLGATVIAINIVPRSVGAAIEKSSAEPEDELDLSDASPKAVQQPSGPSEQDELSKELAKDELGAGQPSEKKPDPRDDLSIPNSESTPQVAPEAAAPVKAAPEVSINDLLYVSKKKGGTVVVETSAPATFHTREMPDQKQVVIDISNAHLPERLKQPFLTKDFQQAITSIIAYQEPGSSTARIVVQFKSSNHPIIHQDGTHIELSPSDMGSEMDDSPTLGVDTPRGVKKASRSASPAAEGLDDADPRILPATSVDPVSYDNIKFYGKPISLEVRDTLIRDVINVIAEQSGANIVIGSDVEGTISLKLRKIPWDQALLIVLKSKNLGYVRQGSILRIAKYDSLRTETVEAQKVVDAQRQAEPLKVKIIPVSYAQVKDLTTQLNSFVSPGRGKVVADSRTNSLIVTDVPEVLERVANLVKALDLAPLQVLIEGKVVEATEAFERDMGFNWGATGTQTALGGGQSITPSIGTNGSVTSPNSKSSQIAIPLPPNGMGGIGISVSNLPIFNNLTATLSLAEIEGLAHIISSPRIVAVNNEAASITQGTNLAIQTTTVNNGAVSTSTNYQAVEMKLDVTPQVTSENDVIMLIKIKRDFAGSRPAGGGSPDINHREASTRVLVRNGQTAVVGGVYQNDTNEGVSGVPGLKNLPVIGWLFKSRTESRNKNELLVFLTPRILNAETALQKESSL